MIKVKRLRFVYHVRNMQNVGLTEKNVKDIRVKASLRGDLDGN